MRRRSELPGDILARQIHKDYVRSGRRLNRTTRRLRRQYGGGWIYRLLWPDPVLAIGCYLLVALAAAFFALLIYGQITHGGDPLWWARCSTYAHCRH